MLSQSQTHIVSEIRTTPYLNNDPPHFLHERQLVLVGGEQVEQLAPQVLVSVHVGGQLRTVGVHFPGFADVGSVEEPEKVGTGEAFTEEEGRIPVSICNCWKNGLMKKKIIQWQLW